MTMTHLNGQEVPEAPEEQKQGFIKRHKKGVALSVAGLFLVGGIGVANSNNGGPAPEAPVTAQESPKAEEPVQPSPEPVAPSPEPVQEEVQPEPVAPVAPEGPTDATTGVTVPDAPAPAREAVAADFDLPQNYDDAFVAVVIEQVPFAQYANPDAMVDVAMETCAQLANGYTAADIEAIANAVYAPGTGEHDAAIAAIYVGNGFYCPELG